MTDSTDVYWDVDGVSLHTYAWAIRTLGGDRDNVPQWRGQDRLYPYVAGADPRPQVAASRTQTLLMWVVGMEEDGTVPPDMEVTYNENRRMLKRLFWKPRGALFEITKRWRTSTGIVSATAKGRLANDMGGEMMGPRGQRFAVDVFLPDPWYYGVEETTVIELDTPTVIDNLGDDVCTRIEVDFEGQLVNPELRNTTPEPDVWMRIGAGISDTDTVTASVDGVWVTRESDSANLIGAVTHSGARAWMGLDLGENTMVLTADGGAGQATVRHRPAYF